MCDNHYLAVEFSYLPKYQFGIFIYMIITDDDLDIHLVYIIINNCYCRILGCSGKGIQKNLEEPPSCGDYKRQIVDCRSGTLSGFVKCKVI